jgi:hypothetical protein
MINNWEDYNREIELRKRKIKNLENKALQNNNREIQSKLHELRNEFTVWSINTYMDLEEKLGNN